MHLKTSPTPAQEDVFGVGENRLRLIAPIHFMERDGLRQSDSPAVGNQARVFGLLRRGLW
jgi:hypothetical protein